MVRTQPLYVGHMLFQLSYWGAPWALFDIGSVCNIAGSNSLVKSSHSKLCSRTPPPSSAFIRLLLCAHKYCYLCHMWCVRATLTSIFPVSWWCLVAQHLPEQSTCVGAHRDWKSLYLKYWICCFIITTSPSLQIYLHVLQSALSVCVSAVRGGCWMFSLHKNLTKTLFRQKSSKDKKCMQRWKCPFSEYPVLYKL